MVGCFNKGLHGPPTGHIMSHNRVEPGGKHLLGYLGVQPGFHTGGGRKPRHGAQRGHVKHAWREVAQGCLGGAKQGLVG